MTLLAILAVSAVAAVLLATMLRSILKWALLAAGAVLVFFPLEHFMAIVEGLLR